LGRGGLKQESQKIDFGGVKKRGEHKKEKRCDSCRGIDFSLTVNLHNAGAVRKKGVTKGKNRMGKTGNVAWSGEVPREGGPKLFGGGKRETRARNVLKVGVALRQQM